MSGKRREKQAVVIIHGMGEQRAMDTLRGFADVVWTGDRDLREQDPQAPATGPVIWSKPDHVSDALELRRLTTTHNLDGVRTDFFEFYWAHLMSGTRFSHVLSWVRLLLFRRREDVPDQLYLAWIVLWFITALIGVLLLNLALPEDARFLGLSVVATAIIGAVLGWINLVFIAPIIGDAARYLSPAPPNVSQRRKIRDEGTTLLKKLIDSGAYTRIIVVGHSLGSIIGYDILRDVWADYNRALPLRGETDALERLQAAANAKPFSLATWRAAQRDYADELRLNGNPWCVTDFVTMGSPLAHGDALLASTRREFREKVAEREFPVSPPVNEQIDGEARFTYLAGSRKDAWGSVDADGNGVIPLPHHAAVFGPVRWTNLFFPSSWLVDGDLIGGPVSPVFGAGVEDVAVSSGIRAGLLLHTSYWTKEPDGTRYDPGSHVLALRQALSLVEGRRPVEERTAGGEEPRAAMVEAEDEGEPSSAGPESAGDDQSATKQTAAKQAAAKKPATRRARSTTKKPAAPRKRRTAKAAVAPSPETAGPTAGEAPGMGDDEPTPAGS